ncbi:unnamed protein product [Cercopithifilaria johnstoni]|uniref:Calcineurin-like phosphoesterase domain-containing protein n=1 Tax=Cercopithifilaria johnstoni TaxID=2874296 RepID=A0A8J2MRD4_9BILA|nr:unnamed protein product [Cercopithifilaria johnstoni]
MDAERALNDCSETQPVILLVHQPNGASKILRNTKKRIDLVLSGHTHAGQFYIVWFLAYLKNDFLYGHYQVYIYIQPAMKWLSTYQTLQN